jgi:hypothetical protein
MLRLLLAALGASIVAASQAAPTCVYRNGNNDLGTSNFIVYNVVTSGEQSERGDTIGLAPSTPRNITECSFEYLADITTPVGTEGVVITLYAADGPVISGANSPGTVLWQSATIPLSPITSGTYGNVRATVPNVIVPDTIIWTVRFVTVAGVAGNRLAWHYVGPPTVGTSDSTYWRKLDTTGGFALFTSTYTNGTTQEGSYNFTLWADGGPMIPYDATASANRNYLSYPGLNTNIPTESWTVGEDISLEGDNRVMNSVTFETFNNVTTIQGDEGVVVSFYVPSNTGHPSPAPFYTSAIMPLNVGTAGTWSMTTVPLPNLTVPRDFVITFTTVGMDQIAGDRVGFRLMSSPNPGQSSYLFYKNQPGTTVINGYTRYTFGNPTPDGTGIVGTYNNPLAIFSIKFTPAVILHHTNAPNARLGGTVLNGVEGNVDASDNVYWQLRPGVVFSNAIDPIRLEYKFTAPGNTPSSLVFTSEDKTSSTAVRRRISAWDYTLGTPAYVQLAFDQMTPANTDLVKNQALSAALNIGAGNEIKVLVGYRATTAVFSYPWIVDVDEVKVTYVP